VSVTTARRVLLRHGNAAGRSTFTVKSILDLSPTDCGQFDVVYSWGALHHTGAMRRALGRASELTKDGGLLLLALYRRTSMCWFWKIEKRLYSKQPKLVQGTIRRAYLAAYAVALRLKGSGLSERRKQYGRHRGMSLDHDVHDWLGGYPYESIAPAELVKVMDGLGFEAIQRFEPRSGPIGRLGIMGSGCFEHEYRKRMSKCGNL
jgi:SAM-dependent methyltransferase